MKKFFNFFYVLPIIFFSAFLFIGCSCSQTNKIVYSISLSISTEGIENIDGKYYVDSTNNSTFKIETIINPSSFKAKDLNWTTSKQDVAVVNSEGVVTCRGEGEVVITASYTNSSTNKVSSYIVLNISKKSLPSFPNDSATITYSGQDLVNYYKVSNPDDENYSYSYYNIDDGEAVSQIINSGNYIIKYTNNSNSSLSFQMTLKVLKKDITISTPVGQSSYGKPLQTSFYNESDTILTQDFILENGIQINSGIGIDSEKTLGKYILTTNASETSDVGIYDISANYVLNEEFQKNYQIKVIKNLYTISKRNVILALNNQTVLYGDNLLANDFKLYDYDEYEQNSYSVVNLSPLSNENNLDYIKGLGTINYVYLDNAEQNQYGKYDVGVYRISYDINELTFKNVSLVANSIIAGNLTIQQREIEITPDTNFKYYGQEDISLSYTVNGVILNLEEINEFLFVDYKEDFGNGNFKAPAGEYNYRIDNSKNKNYLFVLVENSNDIVFNVFPCEVKITFNDFIDKYKTITDITRIATYYDFTQVDGEENLYTYQLNFKSLKVNDEEKVNQIVSDNLINEKGYFTFQTGENIKLFLRFTKVDNSSYYATYQVSLNSLDIQNGLSENFTFSVFYSLINLEKVTVYVTPTQENSTSIYAGNTTIYDTLTRQFLSSSFTLSCEEEDISITDLSQIITRGNLLTLQNEDGKFIVKQNFSGYDEYVVRDSFRDVGQYKVFISKDITFADGKNFYEFVLATNAKKNTDYFFTINPYQVEIVPNEQQGKIYGQNDGIINFSYDEKVNNMDNIDNIKSGQLSRVSGENVGSYKIELGSLSFGNNYKLSISNQNYQITTRQITVTPKTYNTVYGSTYPTIIEFDYLINDDVEFVFTQNDLLPQFSGEFQLRNLDDEVVQKIGNFYPAGNYYVTQGSFNCTSNNYSMSFEKSRYNITPRTVNVSIIPETKTAQQITTTQNVLLGEGSYTISSLIGSPSIALIIPQIQKVGETSYIVQDNDIDVTVTLNTVDVTNCYNFVLISNIVYYIDIEVINLEIVSQVNNLQNLTVTYDGNNHSQDFILKSSDDEYVLDESSIYSLVYTNSSGESIPTNVDNYVVSLSLVDGDKIKLKRLSDDKVFTFTQLETSVDGIALATPRRGYLSITRAEISYNESLLSFESSLEYSSTQEMLPDIVLEVENQPVFTGVDGSELELTLSGDKHYQFYSSDTPIELLTVNNNNNPHIIDLLITPQDSNYNSKIVSVGLYITQKQIVIDTTSGQPQIIINNYGETTSQNLVYDGLTKQFSLNMTTQQNLSNYSTIYGSYRLETFYDNSEKGYVHKYILNDGNMELQVDDDGNPLQVLVNQIVEDENSTIQFTEFAGQKYIKVINSQNNSVYYKYEDVQTSRNAGIYICRAMVNSDANYIFYFNENTSTSLEINSFFEIEKSKDISITNWVENFYYGTIFNLENKGSLEFSFDMYPNYKEDVVFSTNSIEAWEALDYVLTVGTYQVTLTLVQDNYFLPETSKTFNVIACNAVVNFPDINKYVYKGEGQPITEFLSSISVTLKDKNDSILYNVFYEDSNDEFSISYYNVDTQEELDSVPSAVGKYELRLKYESSTHLGNGVFEYEITKQAFSGSITASNLTLDYDPTISASELYNRLMSLLKIYIDSQDYSVNMYTERDNIRTEILQDNSNNWLNNNVVNSKTNTTIVYVISFNDGITASKEIKTTLRFNSISISSNNLYKLYNTTNFNYNGYAKYNELVYLNTSINKTINLAPKYLTQGEESLNVSINEYNYLIKYFPNNIVELYDNLNNLIFRLSYTYKINNGTSNNSVLLPIEPSQYDYSVNYRIEVIGSNYSNNVNFVEQNYKINKINTLYLQILNNMSAVYNGVDYDFIQDVTIDNLRVTNSIESYFTDMKITIYKNLQETSNVNYTPSDGIAIVLKSLKNNVSQPLINSGEYILCLSLLRSNNYDISKYFDYVNIGGKSYSVADFNKADNYDDGFTYKIRAEAKFTIISKPFEYDFGDLEQLIEINGAIFDEEEQTIIVNQNTVLNNLSDIYNVVYYEYKQGEYNLLNEITNLSELPYIVTTDSNFYCLVFEPKNNNFSSSDYIKVKLNKID